MVVFKLSRRPQVQRNEMEIAMKHHDITKLCADSLRSFLREKHSIKLGASHAHELVAAVLGYQSRAALLADEKYPVSNLAKAEFIVFEPPISFIDQRVKSLEGLSPDLPPSRILVEGAYSTIRVNAEFLKKIHPNLRELAVLLANKHARQGYSWKIDPAPAHEDVTIEFKNNDLLLTVSRTYRETNANPIFHVKNNRKVDTIIRLPRTAANIGYGTPHISRNINVDTNLEI